MSFWKILGGAAAGVGVLVALPVAGAVGTVTAVGAGIGAVVGGLAGAAVAESDNQETSSAHDAGERKAAAKYVLQVKKLVLALEEAKARLAKSADSKAYFTLIVALFAIGLAAAYADGEMSAEEEAELKEFTMGAAHSSMPSFVKEWIAKLKDSPPNFKTAMGYVQKAMELDHAIDLGLFEEVIKVVIASDGQVTKKEAALLIAFRKEAA